MAAATEHYNRNQDHAGAETTGAGVRLRESCKMPDFNEIPFLDDRPKVVQLPGGRSFQMPAISDFDPMRRLNEDYYHKLANFEFLRRLTRETRLVITNTGDIPANDVQIEINIPTGNGIGVLDSSDIPERPTKREDRVSQALLKKLKPNAALRKPGSVEIDTNDDRMKIHVNCGNLQPGRKVWTESFFVGITKSGEVAIHGQLYAAYLSKPQEFSLGIVADVLQTVMTLDELIALGDTNDDEE